MFLKGVRVIEYATYVAVPSCGALLAEWGADVIKVEPLTGDPHRHFLAGVPLGDNPDPVFELDNRGKRGISVDTRAPAGIALVKRLAEGADIFLTNVRTPSLERSGLDPASLMPLYPNLIYGMFTGYGSKGPDRDLPGFDVTAFWARTGLSRLTTLKGAAPLSPRQALGDHVSGMALATGVLAALFGRSQTGKGCLVEGSLVRSALYAVGLDFALQLGLGRVASTKSREEQIEPFSNYFSSADGKWFYLTRRGDDGWKSIFRAVGRDDLAEDERFGKRRAGPEHAREVVAVLDAAFAQFPYEECIRRLNGNDVAWSPVQTMAEAAKDPQILAAGAVIEVRDRSGRAFKAPATPMAFPDLDLPTPSGAPRIGEDTVEVLHELGCSDEEIRVLIADGVVRADPEARPRQ